MFLCVCLRELDRGKEQEKAPTSRGRGFTRLRPKHFQSWPGGHFSDLRIVKMPIKATSVCQSWSQNTRSVQLKNTGCTRYKPNALFTPADGMPVLKTHLSFSGNIFRVLNCFDLVVPVFLWSLDYFYLWTPSMGTAAWKRQPCITFTLLRDKAKKKKNEGGSSQGCVTRSYFSCSWMLIALISGWWTRQPENLHAMAQQSTQAVRCRPQHVKTQPLCLSAKDLLI